jgi:hypothetical protein
MGSGAEWINVRDTGAGSRRSMDFNCGIGKLRSGNATDPSNGRQDSKQISACFYKSM